MDMVGAGGDFLTISWGSEVPRIVMDCPMNTRPYSRPTLAVRIYPISGLQFPDTVECWISLLCDFQVFGFPNFRMISNLLSLRLNSFILACISMFDCYIPFLALYFQHMSGVCFVAAFVGFPGETGTQHSQNLTLEQHGLPVDSSLNRYIFCAYFPLISPLYPCKSHHFLLILN